MLLMELGPKSFGFKTNQTHVNVIDDSIRVQSFASDAKASKAVEYWGSSK